MNILEIIKWEIEEGWYINPVNRNRVKLGNGVRLGDEVKLGDRVKLGNGVKLGDWVRLGDGITSEKLNQDFRKFYCLQAKTHIFYKWVTKKRFSANFDGGTIVEYKKGEIVEVTKAIVSDMQCAEGLHVLKYGYRPEWVGLCAVNHDFIPLRVQVQSEDILFAGLPSMDIKLRVKKLLVLD